MRHMHQRQKFGSEPGILSLIWTGSVKMPDRISEQTHADVAPSQIAPEHVCDELSQGPVESTDDHR